MAGKGQYWLLKKQFEGAPKITDFELVTEDLGDIKDGDIVFESEYLSVDPYQRAYVRSMKPPFPMIGSTVAKVVASKDKDFPVGCRIISYAGWRKRGKVNPAALKSNVGGLGSVTKVPDGIAIESSNLLGACGMPGATAYFGLLELCKPKAGETVLVNGAAGAVGSLVGQIAKIKGCKVIGYAGTDQKVAWLKDLGFDHVFNYKKITMAESIKKAAPNGIDCFFDNVGGADSSVVLANMNHFGRAAVCGAISTYNDNEAPMAPAIQGSLVFKQLKIEGFLVGRWNDRMNEAVKQMAQWIGEGKIKPRETVVKGFENTPKAFMGMLTGENIGKMVVQM